MKFIPDEERKLFIRFDYRCPDCGHQVERFIKKHLKDQQICPQCKRTGRRTIMSRLPAAPKTTFRFADYKLKP